LFWHNVFCKKRINYAEKLLPEGKLELDFEIDKITQSIECAKTGESFETLGAVYLGRQRMAIFEDKAAILVNNYFPREE